MALGIGLVSPGIDVREVDLTRGSNLTDNEFSAGIAAPFPKGPVDEIITIRTEKDLIETFGRPVSSGDQVEYHFAIENFLSYGGIAKVVRTNDAQLNNSNVGVGTTGSITLNIANDTDYLENHFDDLSWEWASKNPGAWANNLKVCVIDDFADQTISGLATDFTAVGYAVTIPMTFNRIVIGVGVTSVLDTDTVLNGIITGVGNSEIYVKWSSTTLSGITTNIEYKENTIYELKSGDLDSQNELFIEGVGIGTDVNSSITLSDWYDNQTLTLSSGVIFWRSLAQKPRTSGFARARKSYNDAMHVVIIDDTGAVTGEVGNIVEKFTNLSKAKNSVVSSQSRYYKNFIAENSNYVFAGYPQNGKVSFNASGISTADGLWGQDITSTPIYFNVIGNQIFNLTGGVNYTNANGYAATLEDLSTSYELFNNVDEVDVDFLLMGPSLTTKEQTQAKANKLIAISESRKDCITCISPFKGDVVNVTNSNTQTTNIVNFFNSIDSSSYAVFDSGYKYIYDRFTRKFRYVGCNSDIAGLMVRTSIEDHSWYSPAGEVRGTLNNVIKLAYNPNKTQRDSLYTNRINPIISTPGGGTILFGDKTALSYVSAFDRINVRRLFLELESTISEIAKTFLFEFNDEFTRTSFVAQVEPYLRDVEAKRGITEFLLVCDETNNTPEVIDRNEFVAEVYVKPARSINFIGLTFVATRTGISFEEVVGRF